ncbi:Uncharacterised protein [Chlamydia trachomatis]|nr:Uncharacterised protein [Chlamydia trachomatis]
MLVPIPSENSSGGFALGDSGAKLGGGSEKLAANDAMFEFVEDFIKTILL